MSDTRTIENDTGGGTVISLLSGLALFFFAFSGLWMYVQMWRGRLARVEQGKKVRGGKLFW